MLLKYVQHQIWSMQCNIQPIELQVWYTHLHDLQPIELQLWHTHLQDLHQGDHTQPLRSRQDALHVLTHGWYQTWRTLAAHFQLFPCWLLSYYFLMVALKGEKPKTNSISHSCLSPHLSCFITTCRDSHQCPYPECYELNNIKYCILVHDLYLSSAVSWKQNEIKNVILPLLYKGFKKFQWPSLCTYSISLFSDRQLFFIL